VKKNGLKGLKVSRRVKRSGKRSEKEISQSARRRRDLKARARDRKRLHQRKRRDLDLKEVLVEGQSDCT